MKSKQTKNLKQKLIQAFRNKMQCWMKSSLLSNNNYFGNPDTSREMKVKTVLACHFITSVYKQTMEETRTLRSWLVQDSSRSTRNSRSTNKQTNVTCFWGTFCLEVIIISNEWCTHHHFPRHRGWFSYLGPTVVVGVCNAAIANVFSTLMELIRTVLVVATSMTMWPGFCSANYRAYQYWLTVSYGKSLAGAKTRVCNFVRFGLSFVCTLFSVRHYRAEKIP